MSQVLLLGDTLSSPPRSSPAALHGPARSPRASPGQASSSAPLVLSAWLRCWAESNNP